MRTRSTTIVTTSVFPTRGTGTKSSTVTCTTNGSMPMHRATPVVSAPMGLRGTECQPRQASRCPRTVCWCSHEIGEISETEVCYAYDLKRFLINGDAIDGVQSCTSSSPTLIECESIPPQ